MKLSIAYITARANPMWSLFCDSFCAQTTEEQRKDIQIIFVDGKLWGGAAKFLSSGAPEILLADADYHDMDRRAALASAVAGRFNYLHIPPKPCRLQGPFRETKKDYFCASNTRNTAIIAASGDYLVCVDDLSVVMPTWIAQVMHAAEHGYCVCGAYKKVLNLRHENGQTTYTEYPPGVDSRWPRGSDTGIVPWHGTAMFGCSFGARVEDLLAIDGFDVACDGQGGEDYDAGVRLERSGVKLFYNRNMLTLESEEGHHGEASLPRERRIVSSDRLPPGYDSYVMPNQAEKYYSDHVMLNRMANETSRILPTIPEGLRALRARFLATGLVPVPQGEGTDWRDGTPLREL